VQLWNEYTQTAENSEHSGARLKSMDKRQVLQDLFQKLLELTEDTEDDRN
jgi:hypothetical protein